ncbi:hypothetical protein OB2597_15006 [Pseudooceanicola batsensis HTCC2597]|uniref:Uncharacterized protein n=1 Tax=Pseudooceanicola batsensis (strain ATCC BAA-863 / DSM 15984 / KCTC 12145 / HTCC2597) TaxID=252305 RepID=A3U2G3_PSEBH|nr:hypothetical protein [Pseudooceanicola batsensis]EAQ01763.1 hypothetical protein OB2597_15006 [Pseudooceanicola batsensis HTCC2597]
MGLYIHAGLRALTSAWIGASSFAAQIDAGRIEMPGGAALAAFLTKWMLRSSIANCDTRSGRGGTDGAGADTASPDATGADGPTAGR